MKQSKPVNPLTVECPYCVAMLGQGCVRLGTGYQWIATTTHYERIRLAQERGRKKDQGG